MALTELTPDELEVQLAQLHEASFGWALSCCGWEQADAEDVLQATYLKIVSGRARFGGKSAFKTWLFGVIKQTAREHRRREGSQAERARLWGRECASRPTAAAAVDEELERAEAAERLREALGQLTDKQREVLHLVFYQGLTVREAAEVMQVSLGTARVHYDRGKKRLRAVLAEREVGGGHR